MEIYEYGIDVSRYQGIIDWAKVALTDKKFAIIRVVSSDAGGVYIDPNFERNYKGAKENGIKVGVYYYSYALDKTYADAEISAVVKALEGKQLEYPVFADIEDGTIATLGREKATQLVKYALETLRTYGWFSGTYTYTNFANAYLDMAVLSQYPFWIADYRSAPSYGGTYQMWQYSSSGTVLGVPTRVDLDNSYVNFMPIIQEGGWNGYQPHAPQMIDVSNFLLEVFGTRNCEYFASPDVNDILGSLPNGSYKPTKASMGCFNGFSWVTLFYAGRIVYTTLLPDRCYLTKNGGCEEEREKLQYINKDLQNLIAYIDIPF